MSDKNPTTKLRNLTRDQQIVICYRAGNTQEEIGVAFKLSHARVNQILKSAGCTRRDNPNTPRGDRYAFIGTHVTKDIKRRFAKEAKRRKLSISALTAKLIEDELSVSGEIV